ncbi:unnamed protein product [Schistosoma turkestanicum]|nr:unnamed protein product [Schistosoma turkestanicum]
MSDIRSKSLSLPQVYEHDGLSTYSLNQLKLDKKTKQSVYYICHVCLLKSKEVDLNDELTEEKAEFLIESCLKKRLAHCNLYCLQDQIRFEKSKQCGSNPPRKFILYKHIKFMYISENKPYMFILCTEFDKAKRKIYEVYKCKLSQDAKMLYVLLQKALKDKEFLLREEFKHPKVSIGSQCCLINDATINTANTVNTTTFGNNTYYNNETYINSIRKRSMLPVSRSISRNNLTGITSNIYVEHSNELIQKQAVTSASLPKYDGQSTELIQKLSNACNPGGKHYDNTWNVSLVLLQTDFIRGARINDTGPIYMFVARQIK